jgi:type IV pilus assembly protein PilX
MNPMPSPCAPTALALRSRGIALPVVLMFILIITVAVGFGARRALFGERLSGNQLDYEVARQAAEAALRDAERDLLMSAPRAATSVSACNRPAGHRPLGRYSAEPGTTSNAVGVEDQFDGLCTRGQCQFVDHNDWQSNSYWRTAPIASSNCDNFTSGVPLGHFTRTLPLRGVARQPEYLLDYVKVTIGEDTQFRMRVTARGFGQTESTQVVLQTFINPGWAN